MKRMLSFCAGAALTLSAASALAADVTGTWSATAQTPNGDMQLTFTFKQDAAKLTGSVQGPMGDPMDIANGKIDGDKFSFDVSFNGMTIHHDCTVSGDEISMKTSADNADFPAMELTLKRVQSAAPAAPAAPTAAAQPSQPPAVSAQPAAAAPGSVTGTWTTTIQTPNGDMDLSYALKQDGTKLTGTVQGPMGDPIQITNGKIDGDKLAFDVAVNGMSFHYDGTVNGDAIKATTKSDSGDFPAIDLTLKRAKETAPAPAAAPAQPATPPQ
jgi:hypothetical protein